jgi:hypothetical protein
VVDFTEAVRKGVALLDARVPEWREQVQQVVAGLPSEKGGVLSVLFGSFQAGLIKLQIDSNEAILYGFRVSSLMALDGPIFDEDLRHAWQRALVK